MVAYWHTFKIDSDRLIPMKPETRPETAEDSSKLKTTALSPDEFLTTKELMRLLKIKHRQTIYELISSGLPAILVGRSYRFIKHEVVEFLKSQSNHRTSKKISKPQRNR